MTNDSETSTVQDTLFLRLYPATITPFLSDEERESRIVLLDLRADMEGDRSFRIDLDIAFRCVPISRGRFQKRDYYIGTTGGQVDLTLYGGQLAGNTESVAIDVQYSNSVVHERKSHLQIAPKISTKKKTESTCLKPGSVSFHKASKEKYITSFESAEHQLAATCLRDSVSWKLDTPMGSKAIREFLLGNLHLFATFQTSEVDCCGKIKLRASEVSFFDYNKKRIEGVNRTLFMAFAVWKSGHDIPTKSPIKIEFRSGDSD